MQDALLLGDAADEEHERQIGADAELGQRLAGLGVGRYWSRSMPLWMTRMRSGATPYSDCTSCRIDSDTAITPSAFW